MSNSEKQSKHSSIDFDELDLEHDSDTTLASHGFLEPRISKKLRTSRAKNIQHALTWLRWGFVVILQCIIILVIIFKSDHHDDERWDQSKTETGGDINGLYIPSECQLSSKRDGAVLI